ncbi:unnamed protein product [Phytophthora fragariaefolia]|uniref:Unnamed protein product n=1 Tax=Phytophthora fragariaefolia TaxID=1490495 RepID=A0A9W6XTG4_9STRA|nr:unnamed protein product [Phytophthora fragariaefolia]
MVDQYEQISQVCIIVPTGCSQFPATSLKSPKCSHTALDEPYQPRKVARYQTAFPPGEEVQDYSFKITAMGGSEQRYFPKE